MRSALERETLTLPAKIVVPILLAAMCCFAQPLSAGTVLAVALSTAINPGKLKVKRELVAA